MDASTKLTAVLAVAVLLICSIPIVDDEQAYAVADDRGLLISQVNPFGEGEGVTLCNYSNEAVDLKDYSYSDSLKTSKEGTIRFDDSLVLEPGATVTVVKTHVDDDFSKNTPVYAYGEMGIAKVKSFALSDSGDEVFLKDPSGAIIDAVCYGKGSITDTSLWVGAPVQNRGDKDYPHYIERVFGEDTDTLTDWVTNFPGQTRHPFNEDTIDMFDAKVTPFLFPDSGGIPIYRALEQAKESVYIEMYELRSHNVYALLVELEKKGVDVTILHEAYPTGNTVGEMTPDMQFFIDNGGEIKLIDINQKDSDGDAPVGENRFDNMHAKYAVIDNKTVIVTSENWSNANMNGHYDDNVYDKHEGNRGWGVVVESPEYAAYMMDIFNEDISESYGDVYDFSDRYPNAKASELYYDKPMDHEFRSYNAPVTPVVSNDNSYKATKYFIENANERIYSQQQNLTGFLKTTNNPSSTIHMMNERAEAGVDAKFILGGFGESGMSEADSITLDINLTTSVSAAAMSELYVHNKGIISDDYVFVSSVNWTPSSMFMNRECCVIIHSKEVADFYAQAFESDFERTYTFDGFDVDTSKLQDSYESGQNAVFEISVTPEDDYTYKWDFGDGTVRTTDIPKTVYAPTDGEHVLRITITSSDGTSQTVEKKYVVGVPETEETSEDEYEGYIAYLIPILVILLAVIAAVSKTSKKKSKGKGGKKRK